MRQVTPSVNRTRLRSLGVALGLLATTLIATVPSAPTQAAKPTAAVAVGDSFISGEGAGNYTSVLDSNNRVQGYQNFSAPNSNAYFCHRSANAQVAVAALPGIQTRFNVACSGAIPHDIGSPSINRDKGRYVAAQIDQLRAIATTHDIDLVVVNLGANAVGFGDVASKCVGKFLTDAFTGWWEPWVNIWSPHATTTGACGAGDFPSSSTLARAEDEVAASMRLILDTLRQIDPDGQHRVVLQDYVNPLPQEFHRDFHDESGRRDSRDKFRDLARERYAAGCPVHRGTLRHAHNMSESLGRMVGNVQSRMLREYPGADIVYLNVQRAFDGARLCEIASSPSGTLHAPTRAITNSTGRIQHTLDGNKSDVKKLFENCTNYFQRCQEIWHPNRAGHAVLGQCLTAAWRASASLVQCSRRSNGQIVSAELRPTIDLSLYGRVEQGLTRTGEAILHVSASYSASLKNAPGLSVSSVSVTASSRNVGSVGTRRSTSGTFNYSVRCSATSISLTVTISATLSDGSTVRDTATFNQALRDCGGPGVPIR